MNSQEANKRTEPGETVIGYFQVSPVKISKRNNRYFNAVFQIDRYEYLNTGVLSREAQPGFNGCTEQNGCEGSQCQKKN